MARDAGRRRAIILAQGTDGTWVSLDTHDLDPTQDARPWRSDAGAPDAELTILHESFEANTLGMITRMERTGRHALVAVVGPHLGVDGEGQTEMRTHQDAATLVAHLAQALGAPPPDPGHLPPVDETWFLAICRDCTPRLPQPFWSPREADRWARAHARGTRHTVERIDQHPSIDRTTPGPVS